MKMLAPAHHPVLVVLLLLGVFWAQAANSACFTNPLMQGQDPSVEFQDGMFHLVQSDGCNIRLRRSATLGGLATAPNTSILSPGCANLWAPEIHWFNNKWYLYYTLDTVNYNLRGYVAESQGTSPYGPYTIRGILFNDFWNIDGSVFAATNGQLYYTFSGSPSGTQNIYIAPMSNPYTLSGAPVLISQPDQSWERIGDPKVNEGSFGFTRNGRTFIVYSASGCWTDDYTLGLLTLSGTNLLDPSAWAKSGPVFTKQPGAYGPGHNGVFADGNGQWWNVYHANNNPGEGCGGLRQIRIQRLAWDTSDMPVFGAPVPIGSWITDDTNSLAAQFYLNETNGSTAANQSCGPDGMLVGSPVWMNPGLKFNGTSDYVDCGASAGNDVQTALTLAAWVRPDRFGDWVGLITKGTNVAPYALQAWSDGSLRFTANWGDPPGGVGGSSWNSANKLTTNQWQHVAVTYDGDRVRFYIDGVLDANQPQAALRFGVINEPLTIGADFPGGDEYFNGTIRSVRVYGRALSGDEILAVENSPPTLAPVADAAITARQDLIVLNSATDPNAPPQTLRYSLVSAPSGANINPISGYFIWRPTLEQAPSTNLITLAVTDNGSPPLSATQGFTVTVRMPVPPTLSAPVISDGRMSFEVSGDPGPDYAVFNSTNLQDWALLYVTNRPPLPFQVSVPVLTNASRNFYRMEVQ